MRIEYDPDRDLLYIWFRSPGEKSAQTLTIAPGVFADFTPDGRLVGIEILDASELLGEQPRVEVPLPMAVEKGSRSGISHEQNFAP